MADRVITITIPDAKVAIVLQGFLKIYPNEEKNENGTLKYTIAQWVPEVMRRHLINQVRRGLQMLATENAQVAEDNTLATAT